MTTPIEGNELELEVPEGDEPGAESDREADADAVSRAPSGVALAEPTVQGEPFATSPTDGKSSGSPIPAGSAPGAGEPDATPDEASHKPKALQALVDLLHDLAIAVVVCVLLITYVVQAFKVQGTSMSPELGDGERILVNKFLYHFGDIQRGDVVVFWYPEDPELSFIKRVVALPGESVEIREGVVYVDGELVTESYVSPDNADRRNYPAASVRPGHYFVLGDNRKGSNDSRSWGFVPERYIYGKAFLRIWPLGELGGIE